MRDANRTEYIDTIVIGAGQAGLAVGYHLAKRGVSFKILDASSRIGDVWRNRWDSLRLFTPARYSSLPGMRFPRPPHYFPTKDEMADYLESYARHFELPVESGVRVDRLTRGGKRFLVHAGDRSLEADHVVVAMANYQRPKVPSFAEQLDPEIVQLHSSEYRGPHQLREGPLLIVGAGNSGAELGAELAPLHPTWIAGKSTGEIPFRIDGRAGKLFLVPLTLRFLFHRVLTVDTPIGRKARPKIVSRGGPLIRTKWDQLRAAGVQRLPRMTGVEEGRPSFEDGTKLDVANLIWCTGFHPNFSWIDLPLGPKGEPDHRRGEVAAAPGLYFVGLHFLYSLSSAMIQGVGRDAERAAAAIAGTARSSLRVGSGELAGARASSI